MHIHREVRGGKDALPWQQGTMWIEHRDRPRGKLQRHILQLAHAAHRNAVQLAPDQARQIHQLFDQLQRDRALREEREAVLFRVWIDNDVARLAGE